MKTYKHILSVLRIGEEPSNNGIQPIKMNETAEPISVSAILKLMQDQVADQQKQIDGLDTKASVILVAATVFAGAAATLFPGLITNHATILTNSHIRWLLPALISVYVVLVCLVCLAYTVRRYKRIPDPQYLYDRYRDKSDFFIKARVFAAMVKASKENEARVKRKALWVTCSIIGVGIETLILAAILLFQVI
jgi:hypothetical protein